MPDSPSLVPVSLARTDLTRLASPGHAVGSHVVPGHTEPGAAAPFLAKGSPAWSWPT